VDLAGEYFVRFDNTQSKSFSIQVFEFPKLEHANAVITSPAFLEKEPETITDTRKITVMEGSEVEWRLQVNKPLSFAELYGEDEVSIPLKPDSSDPTIPRRLTFAPEKPALPRSPHRRSRSFQQTSAMAHGECERKSATGIETDLSRKGFRDFSRSGAAD
jgi:hypothetical protein